MGAIAHAALSEQAQLHTTGHDEGDVSERLEQIRNLCRLLQRPLCLTGLGEEPRAGCGDATSELDDAASLAELAPFPGHSKRCLRPLMQPGVFREVVVDDGGGAALALPDRHPERPAHIVET